MHRPYRRGAWLVSASLAAAVLGACTSDAGDAGSAAGQEAGAGGDAGDAEASGWPIDEPPTDVEVIDADLVARVLVELDLHLADIHRAVAREGEVGELAEALVSSVYTDDGRTAMMERLEDSMASIREDVATPRSAVVELGTVEVECVDALVRRDLGPVLDTSDGVGTWGVTLVVVEDSDNGTAWRLARDEPGDDPPAGCA